MEMKVIIVLLLLLKLFSLVTAQCRSVYNILDHGAIADIRTDNSLAFMNAFQAACSSHYTNCTQIIHVPANKTFLLNPIFFKGPCNSASLHVEINGNITAPNEPSDWMCDRNGCDRWIHFKHVNGLSIYGAGTINGQGKKWWKLLDQRRPSAMEITSSSNVQVSGIRFEDNPHVHLVIDSSTDVYLSNLTVQAPGNSPNTDSLHIKASTNVFIDSCSIGTGDDCISIVDGSSYLNITNIICGPGHGISIGSLGKGGSNETVEHVYVSDSAFRGSTNGARIKTWQGGKGHARHMVFERIACDNAANPIIIDQYYCDHEHCHNQIDAVHVSNVTFREFSGTSRKKTAVKLSCSDTVPCTDIFMENINLRYRHHTNTTSYCKSVYGRVTGEMMPDVPCLTQE